MKNQSSSNHDSYRDPSDSPAPPTDPSQSPPTQETSSEKDKNNKTVILPPNETEMLKKNPIPTEESPIPPLQSSPEVPSYNMKPIMPILLVVTDKMNEQEIESLNKILTDRIMSGRMGETLLEKIATSLFPQMVRRFTMTHSHTLLYKTAAAESVKAAKELIRELELNRDIQE